MPKHLYELEIEEILQKCEEAARREQVEADARRPVVAASRSYSTSFAPPNDIGLETDHETPARSPRTLRRPIAALGSIALLVSLLLSYFDIVDGTVPLLILVALVALATVDAFVQRR